MDDEQKKVEAAKFEEYVYSMLPDIPIDSLRRLKKMVRKVLKDRNWELRWRKQLNAMTQDELDALDEQVQARKKKLKAA